MKHIDLSISYRDGHPRVGYLYLSDPKVKSARSKRIDGGMVLDFDNAGNLIGIELLAPRLVTLEVINNVLAENGLDLLQESDLKPLLAA